VRLIQSHHEPLDPSGEINMADKEGREKGNKENRKKAQHTLKEKRKLRKEKKNVQTTIPI
jgi:hypothetical protein